MTDDPASFGRDRRSTWIRYEVAADLLRKVLTVFDAASIAAVAVKGIVTGPSLYADVADRPLADVDLRVRPRDFRRAIAAGRSAGWETIVHTPRFFEGGFRFREMDVEIEGTIGPPGLSAITVEEVLARAGICTDRLGATYRAPETNDHALILAINVFKDRLHFAAAWAVEDLVRIARVDDFDPATVAARARSGHVGNAVALVAHWIATTRASVGWGRVRDALSTRPRRPLYDRFFSSISNRKVPPLVELVGIAAGGDGTLRPVGGAALATAGWIYGGVMRRVDRLRTRA